MKYYDTARHLLGNTQDLFVDILLNDESLKMIPHICSRLQLLSHIVKNNDRDELVKTIAQCSKNLLPHEEALI